MTSIREITLKDLPIVERVFTKSILSIQPSIFKTVMYLFPLLIFSLAFSWIKYLFGFLMMLAFLIHLGIYLYIKMYIYYISPTKCFSRYQLNRSKMFALIVDNQIIGFSSIKPYRRNSCWVTYFFMDPGYQKKGYGVKLADGILQYFLEMKYDKLYGRTSFIQTSQLKLMRKYIDILKKRGLNFELELNRGKKYWWIPIYYVDIIYTAV